MRLRNTSYSTVGMPGQSLICAYVCIFHAPLTFHSIAQLDAYSLWWFARACPGKVKFMLTCAYFSHRCPGKGKFVYAYYTLHSIAQLDAYSYKA